MARVTKGRVRAALRDNGGVIAAVAEQFGVTRQTIYNWLDKYGLHNELDDARADIHDVAEANIYRAVMGGDTDMSKFVLTHMPVRSKQKWSSKQTVEVGAIRLSEDTMRRLEALGVSPETVADEFEAMIRELHMSGVNEDEI